MNSMEITPVEAGQVQEFYRAAMSEMDNNLLRGEYEAKTAVLAAMASGNNAVLFGAPGGGKTTLAEHMPRLVEGMDEGDLAIIPPQADLTPQMLIGGQV